jgi:hypothetical protein
LPAANARVPAVVTNSAVAVAVAVVTVVVVLVAQVVVVIAAVAVVVKATFAVVAAAAHPLFIKASNALPPPRTRFTLLLTPSNSTFSLFANAVTSACLPGSVGRFAEQLGYTLTLSNMTNMSVCTADLAHVLPIFHFHKVTRHMPTSRGIHLSCLV